MAASNRPGSGQGMGLSLSGYTPVFDSVFTGTLCGKWPDTGIWVCLLAMADKHGVIDKTPQYISAVVGIDVDELIACLARFMAPDPHSRSGDEEGRRLVPIDAERLWGWRIVNHEKYREKARKAAYDAARTESGADAERKRASRALERCPDLSRAVPLSNTNTNTNTNTEDGAQGAHVVGLNFEAWGRFEAYRREIRKPIKPGSVQAAQLKLAGFGADQAAVVEESIAQGWTGLFPLKQTGGGLATPRKTRYDQAKEALERATATD